MPRIPDPAQTPPAIRTLADFLAKEVFGPLEMSDTSLGCPPARRERIAVIRVPAELEKADWYWNSPYWRALGAPWGTAHASAPDVARFFAEFLHPTERMMKPDTARLMVKNHNPEGFAPRGLGFAVGSKAGINFRSLPGSDLASLSPVSRSNPKMPQAVRLIARVDNFLAIWRKSGSPHSRSVGQKRSRRAVG